MPLLYGYKHTEAGGIPEDWEVSKFGKHATFKTCPFGRMDAAEIPVGTTGPWATVGAKTNYYLERMEFPW